jgi:hypothetical protein
MSDSPKTPRVSIKVMRGGQLSFGLGYLVIRDGLHWCVQNEEDIDKDPRTVAGALPLDPLLLESQPMPNSDVPHYNYRVVFQLV